MLKEKTDKLEEVAVIVHEKIAGIGQMLGYRWFYQHGWFGVKIQFNHKVSSFLSRLLSQNFVFFTQFCLFNFHFILKILTLYLKFLLFYISFILKKKCVFFSQVSKQNLKETHFFKKKGSNPLLQRVCLQ